MNAECVIFAIEMETNLIPGKQSVQFLDCPDHTCYIEYQSICLEDTLDRASCPE